MRSKGYPRPMDSASRRLNKRQKVVIFAAFLLVILALYYMPFNMYWPSDSAVPELIWKPLISEFAVDYPRYEIRYDILIGEFVLLAVLTWTSLNWMKCRSE